MARLGQRSCNPRHPGTGESKGKSNVKGKGKGKLPPDAFATDEWLVAEALRRHAFLLPEAKGASWEQVVRDLQSTCG